MDLWLPDFSIESLGGKVKLIEKNLPREYI
jgi:hypothetical protein